MLENFLAEPIVMYIRSALPENPYKRLNTLFILSITSRCIEGTNANTLIVIAIVLRPKSSYTTFGYPHCKQDK